MIVERKIIAFPPEGSLIIDTSPVCCEEVDPSLIDGHSSDKLVSQKELFWIVFCQAVMKNYSQQSTNKNKFVIQGKEKTFKEVKESVENLREILVSNQRIVLSILLISHGKYVFLRLPSVEPIILLPESEKKHHIWRHIYSEILCPALRNLFNGIQRQFRVQVMDQKVIFFRGIPDNLLEIPTLIITKTKEDLDQKKVDNSLLRSLPEPKKRTFNIFFDIHNVLSCRSVCVDIDNANHSVPAFKMAHLFKKLGSIIQVPYTHYIFPGVQEMLTLLGEKEDVHLSIFSKGSIRRNELITEKLFEEILIANTIFIYCSEHFINNKKNIRQVLIQCRKISSDDEKLNDAVLVDANFRSCPRNQFSHFLYAPSTNAFSFTNQIAKEDDYCPKGLARVGCYFYGDIDPKYVVRNVFMKKNIAITFCDSIFSIIYWNETSKKCCIEKLESTDPLSISLQKFIAKCGEGQKGKINPQEKDIIKQIGDYVENLNGKVFKIYRKANHIYLIAYLLFEALEKARKTGIPLKLCLPIVHPENSTENGWAKDDSLYKLGLAKLREVNPNLKFMHPYRFKKIMSETIEESEQMKLMEIVDKECQINYADHLKKSLRVL